MILKQPSEKYYYIWSCFFFNFNNMSMNIMYTAQKETSDLLGQEPILRELTKKLVSLILL